MFGNVIERSKVHSLIITVKAGYYNDYSVENGKVEWEYLCYSTISDKGRWHTTHVAMKAIADRPVERVISEKTSAQEDPGIDQTSKKVKEEVAGMLARGIMSWGGV